MSAPSFASIRSAPQATSSDRGRDDLERGALEAEHGPASVSSTVRTHAPSLRADPHEVSSALGLGRLDAPPRPARRRAARDERARGAGASASSAPRGRARRAVSLMTKSVPKQGECARRRAESCNLGGRRPCTSRRSARSACRRSSGRRSPSQFSLTVTVEGDVRARARRRGERRRPARAADRRIGTGTIGRWRASSRRRTRRRRSDASTCSLVGHAYAPAATPAASLVARFVARRRLRQVDRA